MNSNDYNSKHWHNKLPKYLNEEWSKNPSPFVQYAATFLTKDSMTLELGTGAGQDGIWLEKQGYKVVFTDADDVVFAEISKRSINNTKPVKMNITHKFPFEDNLFDAVYAQLVLHYFDDKTLHQIIKEIKRVLKPDGILACMMNSTSDSEYDESLVDDFGLVNVNGLVKRFFTVDSFMPFVKDFVPLLFDNKGRTPKDDAVGTSGMIQFIGKVKK